MVKNVSKIEPYPDSQKGGNKLKLSSRGHYGLQAMVNLARTDINKPVPLRRIATEENIPEQFLEQIFVDLRKAGLVKSVRGAKGGYLLADKPENIVVGNIVRILEGTNNIIDCIEDNEDGTCCDKTDDCTTRIVWDKVRISMFLVLDGMALSDLAKSGKSMTEIL